jgi:Zinc knuckle
VNKCWNCGRVGHYVRDCWAEKKEKYEDQGKKKGEKGKGKETEESNIAEEQIAFTTIEESIEEDEELYNFDMFNACNAEGNDEHLILYDW